MPQRTDAGKLDFVMGFVAGSKRFKDQYVTKFREQIANFLVDPQESNPNRVDEPYSRSRTGRTASGSVPARGIIFKSGDTHKAVMTFVAKLVLTILGDNKNEYVRAEPVGYEDATLKAPTVTRLLRYAFSLPGGFRALVEAFTEMLTLGTAIVEIPWVYQERDQPIREFVVNEFGEEDSRTFQGRVVSYDDPKISIVGNEDFYPDPGECVLENMAGVAKRFRMNALKARQMAESGIYDSGAVERAIANTVTLQTDPNDTHKTNAIDDNFKEGIQHPDNTDSHDDFTNMIGFEYWGEVPWGDDKSSSRRVITVLMGEVVRDDPYPLADADLPFRALVINPVEGRFYGLAPAEVIRFDQDIQDAMDKLLVMSIIRQVHPPIAYDSDDVELDMAKVRRWAPDVPIGVRGGPKGLGAVRYDANVFNGFNLVGLKKQQIQETSGALGGIQGQEGPDREAATVGALRFQHAESRVELAAMLLEKEAMPGIAKSIIRRYQQFLPDTQALQDRIGELPQGVWIGHIAGDFDVQFVGSRLAVSRQQKLQMWDRLTAMATVNPVIASLLPNIVLLQTLIGDVMELPEVAAQVGDPQVVQQNLALQLLAGGAQGGAGRNGVAQRSEPAGTLPAQAGGSALG